jgi:hypothetical protein
MSRHLNAAQRAIDDMAKAQDEVERARERRDAAIRRMFTDDHLSPPAIGRALAMSTSNVRLVLRDAGLAR